MNLTDSCVSYKLLL